MTVRAALLAATLCACLSCSADDYIDSLTTRLVSICLAHTGFQPSSIDFYDPVKAQGWEKEFYEGAKSLHKQSSIAITFLLDARKSAAPDHKQCIDGILNTWPG